MKNKKLFLTLTLILALFSFNLNVNAADESEYEFYTENFNNPTEFMNFFNKVCTGKSVGTCLGSCVEYENNANNGPYIPGGETAPVCKKYKSFHIKSGKFSELKTFLKDNTCNNQSCLTYVYNNYCKNYKRIGMNEQLGVYNVCNNVYSAMTSSDTSLMNCPYNTTMKGKAEDITVNINVLKKSNKMLITITRKDKTTEILEENGTKKFDKDVLNFYQDTKTFSDFKSEYIKKYNQNKTCPALYFVQEKDQYSNYIWNTYLNESDIDKDKYYISSENGKTDYHSSNPNGGMNLIGAEKAKLSCDELFSEADGGYKIRDLLKFIVNLMKISIPMIIIGLGTLDLSKAVFSGSEDAIKKAQSKLIKRIIIGVCVFLVPSLIKFFLTIGSQVWDNISTDFCGIL